jgi:hypothetical protein
MGRRDKRKRERRAQQRGPTLFDPGPRYDDRTGGFDDLITSFESFRATVQVKQCGNCREFIEDAEGGRGTCLHPGSGILAPWTDTAACDFHARRR